MFFFLATTTFLFFHFPENGCAESKAIYTYTLQVNTMICFLENQSS